jgi:hypothetical protein
VFLHIGNALNLLGFWSRGSRGSCLLRHDMGLGLVVPATSEIAGEMMAGAGSNFRLPKVELQVASNGRLFQRLGASLWTGVRRPDLVGKPLDSCFPPQL